MMIKIATTALLSVLCVDHVGLGGTPPAIVEEGAEHEKEEEGESDADGYARYIAKPVAALNTGVFVDPAICPDSW